ncbi:MAG: hypothetical protein CFE32_22635, partial [Alphaproteobacteria bacterium PA3]
MRSGLTSHRVASSWSSFPCRQAPKGAYYRMGNMAATTRSYSNRGVVMDWFNSAAAAITILMGCLGLFFPEKASALTGLVAATPSARAEFRGTLGVTFIFLGAVPLASQNPHAFLTAGMCWFGAGVGRVISIFL